MDGLRQYLLGIISAAMVCGVVLSLFPDGTIRKWLQWTCGIFLTIVLLSPLGDGLPENLLPDLQEINRQAKREAERGTEMADTSQRAVIKRTLEAYVLDKAKIPEGMVRVDITLSPGEVPVPVAAFLRGDVTEEQRETLSAILEEDLEIPKEAQTWIGAA